MAKIADLRVKSDDELSTLQRNIVLSHAAGTGAPCRRAREILASRPRP